MKICIVHNEYGKLSGEEIVVGNIRSLLEEHGHEVIPFFRSSAEIPSMLFGNIRAFFNGIYSVHSQRKMRQILQREQPDIVHIHNLFPLISPSILPECKKAGVPAVMTVHNYRLICSNGLYMTEGHICEKCSYGNEYWCVIRNCEKNLFKSFGYALRNYASRKKRFFLDNIAIYAALTEFQREKLIMQGFPRDKIVVIPNMIKTDITSTQSPLGDYIGFAGRISPEKGISTLMNAARMCDDISFKLAGNYDKMPELVSQSPKNFEFLGHLDSSNLNRFLSLSRIIVLTSICYEGFPMLLAEAMIHEKPVICSRIGGLPEIVEHGVNGLLFEPGNAEDLADKIRYLWDRPELCRKMGQAGREKVLREYSSEKYYERLMDCYQKAVEFQRSK